MICIVTMYICIEFFKGRWGCKLMYCKGESWGEIWRWWKVEKLSLVTV